MAITSGIATNPTTLIAALVSFANGLSTTPWTIDESASSQATLSRGNCVVSWWWNGTGADIIQFYQSLGWVTSTTPNFYTNDSGQGGTTSTDVNARHIQLLSSGPYNYWFFAGEGSNPYIHCVLEIEPNKFRHFGFGNIDKYSDWTGGEYTYGGYVHQNTIYVDVPSSSQHTMHMDHGSGSTRAAIMRATGLPNEDGSAIWGVMGAEILSAPSNDRGGNPRVRMFASARSGLWGRMLQNIKVSPSNSFKPLMPIEVLYKDYTDTPDSFSFLGKMEDVAIVNMGQVAIKSLISDGTNNWQFFPWNVKSSQTGQDVEACGNAGFAYKVIP